jgi:hypothetical protein
MNNFFKKGYGIFNEFININLTPWTVAPVPSLMISLEIFLSHLKRNPTDK